MAFKKCVVNSCLNNSKNNPKKIFLNVPRNEKRRQMWCKALNTKKIPDNNSYCVCEDHFDVSIYLPTTSSFFLSETV